MARTAAALLVVCNALFIEMEVGLINSCYLYRPTFSVKPFAAPIFIFSDGADGYFRIPCTLPHRVQRVRLSLRKAA